MMWPSGPNVVNNHDDWVAPPKAIALSRNEIHIWRAQLDLGSLATAALTSHLSAEETARAARFRMPEDRRRFAVCRGILRELLGVYLRCPPADVVISSSKNKKPCVNGDPSSGSVCFNLSHSGELAAYAFAQGRELGIDIELFRENIDFADIAERYFADREKMQIRTAPPDLRQQRFFECWTRQEAYLKALGEGLPLLDQLRGAHSAAAKPEDPREWSHYTFTPSPVHAGALVAEGRDHQLRFWTWKPEKSDYSGSGPDG